MATDMATAPRMTHSAYSSAPSVCRLVCALSLAGLGGLSINSAFAEVVIEPSIRARMTYTDNVSLTEDGEADFVTEVTPSISVRRTGGRLTGSASGGVRNVSYANDSDRSSSFIDFRGRGQYEAIDDTLFIEAVGSVGRRDRSLFSARSESDALNTDSSNETRFFSLAPRLEFSLGAGVRGTLRYQQTWNSGASATSRQRTGTWNLNLADQEALGALGWFFNYSKTNTQYDGGLRDVNNELMRLGLSYQLTPRFVARGSVGRESNDFSLQGEQEKTTHGFGFDWTPTPRTSFSAFTEERLFGRSYDVSLRHRARRSAWSLIYSRDYSSSNSVIEASAEDYYYNYWSNLLSDSGVSDPALLDALARLLAAQNGSANIGFVSNTQTLRRNLRGTVTLTGVRNTVTVSLYRNETERLTPDLIVSGLDDFALSNHITTSGATASWVHRVSGASNLNASLSRQDTQGDGGTTDRDQTRTGLSVGLTRRIGPNTNGALLYTHTRRSGDVSGDENSLSATLGIRF
ncbi:MAG: TIGR03016 family PEP-CTERM system-associated outer membrane protein [Porticoccaceae bacterium]|nr:TIGR03016 family PEP-CTERM system-associated outer membrane protein [Porticoccaceae bacterium]